MSMKDITDKMNGDIDKDIRARTIGVFRSIIMMTPVGDPSQWQNPSAAPPGYVGGRARGNWQCSLDAPIANEIDRIDASGSGPMNEVVSTVASGRVNYLSNNVPYIRRLEYDQPPHSKQAPQGMVRISLQRFGLGEIV
jgi:hypothetical protein